MASARARTSEMPADRRARRTRRALQTALVELSAEIGWERVTVDQLTERADVARPTFYLHFNDKHQLLEATADDALTDLAAEIVADRPQAHAGIVRAMFRHAEQRATTYRLLLSGAGDGRPLDKFLAWTADFGVQLINRNAEARGTTTRVPVDAVARIWSGELIACIRWWITAQTPYSAEEIATIVNQTRFHGLPWVYGSSPDDPRLAPEAPE